MRPTFTLVREPVRKQTEEELWQQWYDLKNWPVYVGWMERRCKRIEAEWQRRREKKSA